MQAIIVWRFWNMNLNTSACTLTVVVWGVVANAALTNYFNFETAPVHPIALGPDGHTLAVCNLPDNRVELFDVSFGVPSSVGSVPVGLDPVTARFASSNELWVVNHISSTISIVDVAAKNIVATLETPAGPSDVVFAGSPRRAWISCSRTNAVFVIDVTNRSVVTNLAIEGERPRAMAVSPNGSNVYVAIFESGNGTTILGRKLTSLVPAVAPSGGPLDATNSPYGGQDPPPNAGANFIPARAVTNTPPRVSHIVRRNAAARWLDDNGADWTEWVSGTNASVSGRISGWDLPDRDVAIIDTATFEVTYAQRLMNICMAIGVNPVSGEIAVVGTDGTNEKRFEPNLKGVFLRVRLGLVDPVTRTNRLHDLNPHLDYITRTLPAEERALGLGDPRGIEWNSAGTRAYITGMGSRNMIVVDADGQRVNSQPIELGEGPTGIALDESRDRLYVWNRFSSTISVVSISGGAVVTNVAIFDPTPEVVRKGRRHLYDTRKNSGLGIVSCASCHVDARFDRLAWDLGDPAGTLVTNAGFTFHPMKGPMVTQTFQDIITPPSFNGTSLPQQPLHWRGDRKGIEEFNSTFTALLGNNVLLTSNEMGEFKAMLATISFPPNFYRTFSNTMPESIPLPGHFGRPPARAPLPPGNANSTISSFSENCRNCHEFNQGNNGLGLAIVLLARNGTEGALKSSQLRSLVDKFGMDGQSTNSRSGFGFMHDGRVDTLTRFLVDGFPHRNGFHFFQVSDTDQQIADMIAFLLCFSGSDFRGVPPPTGSPSQDVPAALGRQVTFSSPAPPPLLGAMIDLVARTNNLGWTQTTSRVELVLRGKKNGQWRAWLLRRPQGDFQSDRNGESVPTLAGIIASAAPNNEFTATLVPEGSGNRLALDRDGDGYFDTTEIELGYNPADPASHPVRIVNVSKAASGVAFAWESASGAKYAVEWTTNSPPFTSNSWSTLVPPFIATTNITGYTDAPPAGDLQRFYRVRKEP